MIFCVFCLLSCKDPGNLPDQYVNWRYYQGDQEVSQYVELSGINKSNVQQLKKVWSYRSGGADSLGRSQIQCNPVVMDGVLYGTNPQLHLFALDAVNGEEIWKFIPHGVSGATGVNRGVVYWSDGNDKRIYYSVGAYLYSVDAAKGVRNKGFGINGRVHLREGLGRDITGQILTSNTPGIIYQDKLIIGSRVSESTGPLPGHIRAFNIHTGTIEWTFHTIPHPGEPGYETWPSDAWKHSGGANAWSGFSLDAKRGWVFAPTGSASFDFYGGDRHGDNLYANCILALDAKTGELIWHYQVVHHDLWDRDLPAPPNLTEIQIDGRKVEVVVQILKSGYILILDRQTGIPLFPIQERPVPSSRLQGEKTSETQPFILKPQPFSRQTLELKDLATRSDSVWNYAKWIFDQAKPVIPFTPFDTVPGLLFPGFDGGGEWGGAAIDPDGILYVNSSEIPWVVQMLPIQKMVDKDIRTYGSQIYQTTCSSCHGANMEGGTAFGNVPALSGITDRLSKDEVTKIITNGKGTMPSFASLQLTEIEAVVSFILNIKGEIQPNEGKKVWPYPYRFLGYNRFYGPDGFPAITPPWGQLTAVDLASGTISWQTTLGDLPEARQSEDPPTGTENYGGPVVTAGGLIFIAATQDNRIRAFDKDSGKLLWEHELPAAGYATPAVYAVSGKEYVVIACGGGKLGSPSGDYYIAFAL